MTPAPALTGASAPSMHSPVRAASGCAAPVTVPVASDATNPAEISVPVAAVPQLFGSVEYWVGIASGRLRPDPHGLFDKRRKEAHLYTIADVNGPLTLTVPIVKPHGISRATWADVRLSDHGNWWHVHRTALESAYGRTPFFEFYIDRFAPLLSARAVSDFPSLTAYTAAADTIIRDILLLPTGLPGLSFVATEHPYWQPRLEQFGFLPGLSVLDLIFCLGPEAALWLRRALR